MSEIEGLLLSWGCLESKSASVLVDLCEVGGTVKLRGTSEVGGEPVLSLDLRLGLIYTKVHKNLMECSGTFHLFYTYLLYSTGFYTT